MPELDEMKISDLTTAPAVADNTLLETSVEDTNNPGTYDSYKATLYAIFDKVLNSTQFTQRLPDFVNQTVFGALEELKNGGTGASDLEDLGDVNITNPTDGQALVYDATNQEWVNGTGGGGNTDYVELTQAEYDALEQAGQLVEDMMYFITDGQSGGGVVIDDTTTSSSKVWSSQKTNNELSSLAATIPSINDSSTASTVVWSGSKIDSELGGKQDDLKGSTLTSGTDLNSLKSNKVYWCSNSGLTHAPVNAYGFLEVDASSGTSILQKYYVYAGNQYANRGDTYRRIYINSQWYDWVKIASATPENIKVTRTNLTQQGGALNVFTFAAPAITGYTRMVIGFNPSNSSAMYVRTEDDGDNLCVFIQNNLGSAITYDVTIAVSYIRN